VVDVFHSLTTIVNTMLFYIQTTFVDPDKKCVLFVIRESLCIQQVWRFLCQMPEMTAVLVANRLVDRTSEQNMMLVLYINPPCNADMSYQQKPHRLLLVLQVVPLARVAHT